MKKLRFLLSLITSDNDYQVEQAKAAEDLAYRLGASVQIIYAENDPVNQSQQLLAVIQSPNNHSDAIIVEPAGGTGFPHVARAAASAGIGWALLNRQVDYMNELRRTGRAPIFAVSSNHLEVGRIQGQQLGALVPDGGTALYIQGPPAVTAAAHRTLGMDQTKPHNIKLIGFRGNWTEASAYKVLLSWLQLPTSKRTPLDAVVAQNDDMALGARKAFHDYADPEVKETWLSLPFLGCDGLPKTGQAFVQSGLLAATVVIPPNTSVAIEMLARSLQTGAQPSDLILTTPSSLPPIDELRLSPGARRALLRT